MVDRVAAATAAATNEAQLRHAIEIELERVCASLEIAWTPFQLDRTLRKGSKKVRFVDVAHGAVVIEYEAPASFRDREGSQLAQAKAQAQEYALLLAEEEGQAPERYVLVVWDGANLAFGRRTTDGFLWERLATFDSLAAHRIIDALRSDSIPLVHPLLLAQLAGPESPHGSVLIPRLFQAIRVANAAKA